MCDYSLQSLNSRPAKVGDKLVIRSFGTGTSGFAPQDAIDNTVVCVMPGTEIAFEEDIVLQSGMFGSKTSPSKVAIFRQIHKDDPHRHHDAIEVPGGETVLLTLLPKGQCATVLQLPAAPKTEQEAADQQRLEVVG